MDQSGETPPGLEREAPVIVRISGAQEEEIIIVGKIVLDHVMLAQNAPVTITSTPKTGGPRVDRHRLEVLRAVRHAGDRRQ